MQRHLDTADIQIPPADRFLIDESHEALFVRLQLVRCELIPLFGNGRDFSDIRALGARQVSNLRVANFLVRNLFDGAVRAAMEDSVEQAHFLDDELLFFDDDVIANVVGLLREDKLACCYKLSNSAAQCKRESGDGCPDRHQVQCQVLGEEYGFGDY